MEAFFNLASLNLLSPPVLFFVLGFGGAMLGSNLTLPEAMAKTLSIYLMLAIGFKGGAAAAAHGLGADLILALVSGALLSAAIPVIAYGLLGVMAKLPVADRAAVSAHYGSISIVTFVAATAAMKSVGLDYEGYLVAVAAVMETPAILVALYIAGRATKNETGKKTEQRELMSEVFLNSSIVVLTGAFIIGAITGESGMKDIEGFISVPFKGILCLFLLDMGAVAGRGVKNGWQGMSGGLIGFALVMPYISAALAIPFGVMVGLSTGGLAVLMTLAASASYIAVPAAMRLALPEARPSIYLTLSLGITFPMNLTIGIPIYSEIAKYVLGP
jgi:uncharacterized protein